MGRTARRAHRSCNWYDTLPKGGAGWPGCHVTTGFSIGGSVRADTVMRRTNSARARSFEPPTRVGQFSVPPMVGNLPKSQQPDLLSQGKKDFPIALFEIQNG